MKCVKESKGANYYRDDGDRAAWCKQTPVGWTVYEKRNSQAKTFVQLIRRGCDAKKMVDAYFERRDGEYVRH
jgi:hypothetical protein